MEKTIVLVFIFRVLSMSLICLASKFAQRALQLRCLVTVSVMFPF